MSHNEKQIRQNDERQGCPKCKPHKPCRDCRIKKYEDERERERDEK